MKILIACEFSGIVRDAFLAKGHDAMSCDLLSTESPGPHYQGDVFDIIRDGWDMMIAHPPCTYLSSSGMHWTTRGLRDPQLTEDALAFVRALLEAPIERIALENPIGAISTKVRKPSQIIQPWMFGCDASKATCLWLKNLRLLSHSKIIPPSGWKLVKFASDMFDEETEETWCEDCQVDFGECECYGPTQDGIEYQERAGYLFGKPEDAPKKMLWANQTPSGQNNTPPGPNQWKTRSATYTGIARAMADQWG